MKKILSFILAFLVLIISSIMLAGCSNQDLSFGNYTFNKVHISVGEKETCKSIESWHDNEIGCEVKLKDGNVLYLSEGTYILIKNKCPICEG